MPVMANYMSPKPISSKVDVLVNQWRPIARHFEYITNFIYNTDTWVKRHRHKHHVYRRDHHTCEYSRADLRPMVMTSPDYVARVVSVVHHSIRPLILVDRRLEVQGWAALATT